MMPDMKVNNGPHETGEEVLGKIDLNDGTKKCLPITNMEYVDEESEAEREKLLEEILKNLDKFDYVRFVTPDVHNVARGKSIRFA